MRRGSTSGERTAAGFTGLTRTVIDHYESQLQRHGPTAQGMDWKDEDSQRLRFQVLSEICDLNGRSVLDVGAGAGHLHDFLVGRGVRADYSGCDLSPRMVEAARRRCPGVSFEERDILDGREGQTHDVVVCSGLFHVRLQNLDEDWEAFVRAMVRRMFELSRTGIAFNMMTDLVSFRAPQLYYCSPSHMLEFCRTELSRFVTLRHDYPLHEFTVYVYREDSSPVEGSGP